MKKMKHTGKKVLSVFLAVMMIMSAWVFVAPEKASAVEKIYTTNIETLKGITGSTTINTTYDKYFAGDTTSKEQAKDIYSKVIWSGTAVQAGSIGATKLSDSNALSSFGVYYPTTVLMYDGSGTKASFGISIHKDGKDDDSWYSDNSCKICHMGTSVTGTGLSLAGSWRGVVDKYDKIYFLDAYYGGNNNCGLTTTGTCNTSNYHTGNGGGYYILANKVIYDGKSTFENNADKYYDTITPAVKTYLGQGEAKKVKGATTLTVNNISVPIYVIRTDTLLAAFSETNDVYNEITKNYSKYTTESVKEFVKLANALRACNPKNYTWGTETASQVAKYAEEAKAAVDAWNTWHDAGGLREYRAITFDNLFSYNKFTIGGNLTLNERTDEGFTVTSTAPANDPDGNTGFSYAIPVESGKTYVLSADVEFTQVSGGYDIYVHTLDASQAGETTAVPDTSNGAHREGNVYISLTGQTTNKTPYIRFTAGTNTKYIKIRFDANYPGNKLTVNNIRLYNETDLSDVSFVHTKLYDHGDVLGTTLSVPTRTGHTFNCWYLDSNNNGKMDSGEEVTDNKGNVVSNLQNFAITEDYALRSDWTIHKFTVTWMDYEGTEALETDTNVPYGTIPSYGGPKPVRKSDDTSHFTFNGWKDQNGVSYTATYEVKGDVIFSPQFTGTKHDYNLNIKEGHFAEPKTCVHGNRYYVSCSCGKNGTAMFEDDELLPHDLTETAAKAATCMTTGNLAYWYCSAGCNTYYKDATANPDNKFNSLSETVIGLADHKDENQDHLCDYGCETTTSGCEDKDNNHYCDFENCKKKISDCVDTNTNHMCDVCGKGEMGTCADSETDGDHVCDYGCGKVREECSDKAGDGDHKCDICHKDDVTSHTYTEANCTVPATCTECNATNGDALGHNFIKKAEVKYLATPATCNQSATYYKSCSRCDEVSTEIFAYGEPSGIHSYSFKNIKDKFKVSDATCKEYAVYYYSCTCEAIGAETFEYVEGGYAPHVLTHHDADPGEMPCKEPGKIEHWSCSVCEKKFSDADGTNEVTDLDAPLTAHTPGEAQRENEIANTCAKDGSYDEVIYCSVCKTELSRERKTTQATGEHKYDRRLTSDDTLATSATCENQATYYYSCVCGACIREGETFAYGSTAPHIFTKQMKNEDGSLNEEYKKSDATCTEKATYYYACTTCEIKGTATYEVGELAAHTLVEVAAVDATCSKAGNNKYYSCSACKKCFKDEEGKEATTVEAETIAKLSHKWTAHHDYDSVLTEATCQTAAVYNKHCDNCEAKLYGNDATYRYGDPDTVNGHKFDGAVINNRDNTHSIMCSVEGCTAKTEAENCEFTTEVMDVPSTCCTIGYTIYECSTCKAQKTEPKAALDFKNHSGGTEVRNDIPAKCNSNGYTGDTYCLGCKTKIQTGEAIIADKTVHPHENMIEYPGKEATCQEDGYQAYEYCDACQTYGKNKIKVPAKEHKFTDYKPNAENNGTHTATCDTCEGDNKATDTQNCSGGIANCVDRKVCTVCKTAYGEVDATNHKEITVIPQVDPTCQVKGKTSYQKCVCRVVIKEAEDIDTVPHVYGKWQKLEGEDAEPNKHIRYCENCVDTETLDIASQTADCSGGTAYCNKLASCAGCGEEYGTYNPSKHSSKETVIKNAVEATCTSEGNTGDVYYKCCYSDAENADNSKALKSEGEVIPKLDHDFSVEVKVETESTCSKKGTATYKCSKCDKPATKQLPLDKNNHSDMRDYAAQEATCQEDGWEAYKYCEDCDTYEIEKVIVPAKPHTYEEYKSNGNSTHSATCKTCAEGTGKAVDTVACSGGTAYCKEKAVCTICNAEYGDFNSDNHRETTTVEGTKATCQTKGTTAHEVCTACKKTVGEVTETPKLPHEYSEWKKVEGKDQHSRYCTKCVDDPSKNLVVDVQTENCSGGVAYCDALAECTVCKTKYGSVNAANHREYETVPEVPATCQSEGTKAYEKCTKCGAPKAQPEKIAQLAHTFTKYTATADGTHTATCDTCEGENKATDVQNCSGGTATCKKLAECSVCGQEYGSLNAENHEGETTVVGKVDATCQNTGYSGDIYYACCYDKDAADNSGALKEAGKATDILEHSYTIKLSETLATCRATGSATYKCSTCVETDTVKAATDEVTLPIDKNNHASEEVLVIGKLDPTCTTEGYSGDKYHACCYESNKTTSLIQKGYKLSATGVHNYGTAIPEYLVEYTRDDKGKITAITAKTDNLTYEQKIDYRDSNNKWKHVQICADCGDIKKTNCYTYNHTSTCTTTDICEICKGLCSLVNPKNHGGNLILIPAVPATGSTPGTIAHYKCECGKLFFDEARQNQVEDLKDLEIEVTIEHEINEEIPAIPNGDGTHSYTCGHCGEPIVEDCSGGTATCQSKAKCSICGQEYGEIDAKNHITDEVVIVGKKDATCSDSGYTGDAYYKCCYVEGADGNSKALKAEGKVIPNDPSLHVMKLRDNLNGTHTEYCEGCGKYELPAVAHIWVAGKVPETASCTEGYDLGYTCICGATKTEHIVAKHDYAETVKENPADCTTEGKKIITKTCKVCGATETVTETIAALGHDKRTIKGIPATCSTNGSTDYIYCNRCDTVLQDTTVIPATGCEDKNNDGYCDSCGTYLRINEDGSNCGCICHKKNGFMQLLYKFLNFFWKLFKIEKTCDCGTVTHW